MDPSFGTIIWGLLFEPFTEDLKNAITKDVQSIISYDPRLAVNNVIITQYDFGMQLELELTYIPTNQAQRLSVKFDQESQTASVR